VGNIVLYSGVYTQLKTRSEINTWVGAVVGAVPPVMGWTAATGGTFVEAEPVLLAATLFLWQFPHFFALNWMYRQDCEFKDTLYFCRSTSFSHIKSSQIHFCSDKRGGFKMVATSDPNGDRTASLINRYALYLSSIPILSSVMEITSPMFAVEGVLLNAYALHVAKRFDGDRSNANARKVFLTSLWYLPCVMMLFLLHSRRWHDNKEEGKINNNMSFSSLEHFVRRLQDKGRELCLHEAIASKDVWIGSKDNKMTIDESKCPISLTKKEGEKVEADRKIVDESSG
jgi:protoheme IX farnesyltransferase